MFHKMQARFCERSFTKELLAEGIFWKILFASYEVCRYLVSIYPFENVIGIGFEEFLRITICSRIDLLSRNLKENMNKKSVYKKAEEFSFGILELINATDKFNKDFHVSDQISRSSTSIAANLSEAKFSISDKMYLHKVSLAIREAEETSYWLRVLKIKGHINQNEYESLEKDCKQIVAELCALMRFVRNKKK